jgi:hypothetical protein
MKTAFYTIISDSHYHGCRTDEFIKSFKKFHPDIDLFVFGQKQINETFNTNTKLNFHNSKAAFAKKIYNDYDLVVNIDADHLILGSLTEILQGDYDVAVPSNYNVSINSSIVVNSVSSVAGIFQSNNLIPFWKYIQGGLIASTSKNFWDVYEYASLNYSSLFGNRENDILNILCYMLPYNVKILEGHFEYRDEFEKVPFYMGNYAHSNFTCYYGCASLGRENQMVVKNNAIELDGKPVKAYHFAHAGIQKTHPNQLFSKNVVDFIYQTILA